MYSGFHGIWLYTRDNMTHIDDPPLKAVTMTYNVKGLRNVWNALKRCNTSNFHQKKERLDIYTTY